MKLKKITVFSLLLTVLCGCTAQPSNDTNNMLETKTYLYSYDYETEPNGELSTAYHEEKPSVDLNESRNVEKGTVNFKNKNAIIDRKSTRLNSSHIEESRMPSSA